jgi:hypothetical protein
MPKILNSVIPAAVLGAGLLWASVTPSYAKPEYATKEGNPDLNDGGKYYAAHDHSLKGYTPAQ